MAEAAKPAQLQFHTAALCVVGMHLDAELLADAEQTYT